MTLSECRGSEEIFRRLLAEHDRELRERTIDEIYELVLTEESKVTEYSDRLLLKIIREKEKWI